jgi:tripartite motif-containing protein 71
MSRIPIAVLRRLILGAIAAALLALAAPATQAGAASGTWDRAWGGDVNGGGVFGICTVASSCQVGTTGGAGGEMNGPDGSATDAEGNVYVADTTNNRIQKFDSTGAWERAWGKNVNGGGVFGICTVASSCLAGSAGVLGGEMNAPRGVATDASGNVYVADTGNHRIQKFDSSGVWERAWGKDVNGGGVFGICTVASSCQAGTTGGAGGEMDAPIGVATDSGDVYVADTTNNRIQKFDSTGAWERAWGKYVNGGGVFGICTVASSCQVGTTGGAGGEMNAPFGVATDSGDVYVADTTNNRIQKFASTGAWERAWGKNVNGGGVFGVCTVASSCLAGSAGVLGGEMNGPRGVDTDSGDNVYVADTNINRIQKFDSTGAWERAWGKNVNGGGVFGVCTVASSCLAGSAGVLGGEMDFPEGVPTDSSGNVYVADENNNRIQKFADPVVIPPEAPPATPPAATTSPTGTSAVTGRRAAAKRRCKKKFPKGPRRTKCLKKAKRLPV